MAVTSQMPAATLIGDCDEASARRGRCTNIVNDDVHATLGYSYCCAASVSSSSALLVRSCFNCGMSSFIAKKLE